MNTIQKKIPRTLAWAIGAGAALAVIAVTAAVWPKPEEPLSPLSGQRAAVESSRPASIWLSLPGNQTDLVAGQEGEVEIRFDTKGQGVSVVRAVVEYDVGAVEMLGAGGEGSALPMEAVPPGALAPGRAEIVRFIVNRENRTDYQGFSGNGLLAVLRVKPLKEGTIALSLSRTETQFAPYATAREFAFTEVKDGSFKVSPAASP